MSWEVTATLQSYAVCSPPRTSPTIHQPRCSAVPPSGNPLFPSNPNRFSIGLSKSSRTSLRCRSSGSSGENESRIILDAFFLGKAVAEAVNERLESAVGEFLSTVGRLQAEQQKQIQEFQEEVLEKARRAKEQSAREAMEAQGLISKPSAVDASAGNGATPTTSSASYSETSASPSSAGSKPTSDDPPLLGVPNE